MIIKKIAKIITLLSWLEKGDQLLKNEYVIIKSRR